MGFTQREIEVLDLVFLGYTNGEIAERLMSSKRTIEGHRRSLIEKSGLKNTNALIRLAILQCIIN